MSKPKSVNLLDLMTPEEREKVRARQSKAELVSSEWDLLSEIGVFYGWQAIMDVINDVVTLDQAKQLVRGARKLQSQSVYDMAIANLAGNAPKKATFMALMKPYLKDFGSK